MPRFSYFLIVFALATPLASNVVAAAEPIVTVYKSPTCGCCSKWIKHLEHSGFEVASVDLNDLQQIKDMAGIAPEQASCHTARVGDYVIEGHVPVGDIRRLLNERPPARGLTVPGMPLGSPGMEAPNPQTYQVLLIGEDGDTSVFATHEGAADAEDERP
ncbi:MAG: DUF411 domain-containing protein [Thiohalocapsa sp.]